jgi:oxalate decarboxylase/phosphoglucose isomerase-like protein (cupin superfamily)
VVIDFAQQSEEWLYFHSGTARATVFTGNSNARTFDFKAGDTAVFPDNSGNYHIILPFIMSILTHLA